jgi:hypothetical protein
MRRLCRSTTLDQYGTHGNDAILKETNAAPVAAIHWIWQWGRPISMTPGPNQETDLDAATSPRQPEGLPVAAAEMNQPATAQPADLAAAARPSLREADPLLSLLRSGVLPLTPAVSSKPNAKAEKDRLKQDKLENAKLAKAELVEAKSETPPQDEPAPSEWRSMWAVGVVLLALACVVGVLYLIRTGFFR